MVFSTVIQALTSEFISCNFLKSISIFSGFSSDVVTTLENISFSFFSSSLLLLYQITRLLEVYKNIPINNIKKKILIIHIFFFSLKCFPFTIILFKERSFISSSYSFSFLFSVILNYKCYSKYRN